METETFEAAVARERQRLEEASRNVQERRQKLDDELAAIDNELAAIAAYEAALEMELPQHSSSKHYVSINLSHTHLECQNLTKAIKNARRARFTYQTGTFCAICNDWDNARIDQYIDQIQNGIDENLPVRLETVDEWNERWERETRAAAVAEGRS